MNKQLVAAIALSAVTISLMSQASAQQSDPKPGTPPAAATPAATEDIVYMRDGRVLNGQILAETARFVTLEYTDKAIKATTKLNLKTEDIAEIMRDQPVASAPAAPADADANEATPADAAAAAAPKTGLKVDWKQTYGAARFQSSDSTVPSLYIVPMGGQFGTDVRAEVYKPVMDDIRKNKPTLVVFQVDSADTFAPELMFPSLYDIPKTDPALERGMLEFENYRELIHMFRNELADVDQVVWVKNSDGISATVAMAWDRMYMTPTARFGGMLTVLQQSGANLHGDKDVRAKMMAAWLGFAKSFLEQGGYSLELADAMLQPEKTLSGSWKGREVMWQLDTNGEYVVDESDKRTVNFVAKTAEDLCISDGTAADLDDLALLLGYREYRVIDGKQDDLVLGYVKDWRDEFAKVRKNLQDYQKFLSWAQGDDAVAYLGKALRCLESVLASLNQYKAIEIRLGTDFGLDKVTLITWIEQLKEQLRALRQRNTGGGRTGAGGGGRAGQGGGGGGQENPG